MKLTVADVTSLTGGELVSGPPGAAVEAVSIDSRSLERGDLFIAVSGPRHDGHDFVPSAIERGAAGVVVSTRLDLRSSIFQVLVHDTTRALQDLAHGVRERSNLSVVAITGSMGKTTTKDAAAAALSATRRVLKTQGNLNNAYGLPLSLLKHRGEDVAVLEMGMSEPGEIARLVEIARPDVGVLTNVAAVHLEFFDSVAAIAEAKGELLEGLADDAFAVVNADDPLVLEQARKFAGRQIRFGLGDGADVRARDVRATPDGLRFQAVSDEGSVEVSSALHGKHNVYNLLAGIAAARALDVPLVHAAKGVGALTAPAHRGERRLLPGNVLVIDETYNSNPVALGCALDALADEAPRTTVAVVGDMLELGPTAAALHRDAGRHAASAGLRLLVGVGPLSREILAGAKEAGMDESQLAACGDAESAGTLLAGELRDGDAVLLKASRGVGLDRAIEIVTRALNENEGEGKR